MNKTKSPGSRIILNSSILISLTAAAITLASSNNARNSLKRTVNSALFDLLRATPNYASLSKNPRTYSPNSDIDRDNDVDLADYDLFSDCFTNPTRQLSKKCFDADLDTDGDVDLRDYAAFQRCYGDQFVTNPDCIN